MSCVLIYAPDVDGHPRVYCRAIADALRNTGWPVVVAVGFRDGLHLSRSPDLAALEGGPGFTLRDVGASAGHPDGRLTAEEVVALQSELAAQVTILVEADKFRGEFVRMARGAAPRLVGRTLAIFAETSPWHPGEDAATGVRLRGRWTAALKSQVRRIVRGKTAYAPLTDRQFYEDVVVGMRLVDGLLVKDERLAAAVGPPVVWMPEMSRPLAVPEAEDPEARDWRTRIDEFLAAQPQRKPILYFGDDAYYKGYDLWLELLRRHPEACGIHAGRTDAGIEAHRYAYDTVALRRDLTAQGRLLEYGGYVSSQAVKRASFQAVPVYVTTHRLALSSSTCIQAAEFGVPMLVPDRGLLAHRVSSAGLGMTYRYGDLNDLIAQARRMWSEPPGARRAALAAFYARFDERAIAEFWRRLVGPVAA